MLRFFRRLRKSLLEKGSVSKYILYALGEILLVMIGILLALQVNNWNEHRKEIESEKIVLRSAIESIREDSVLIVQVLDELDRMDQLHKQILDYTKGILPADEIGNLMYLRRSLLYNPILKSNHPNLSNEVLRQDIKQLVRRYYKQMDDGLFVVTNFNEFIEETMRPVFTEAELSTFGFQFSQNIEGDFRGLNSINREALIAYLDNPKFQNILVEVGLKYTVAGIVLNNLLTENTELVKQLNSYLEGR